MNFGALVDVYATAFEGSDASAQNEFLLKVSASVKSREENRESARQMYLSNRKFRFLIDEGCRKDSDACKVLVREVVEWKPLMK